MTYVVDTKPASTKKHLEKYISIGKRTGILLKHIRKTSVTPFVLNYEGRSVETLWLQFKVSLDETEKMAHDSKIVRAKEKLKLSHGGPS